MATIKDKAETILTEKNEKILPDNFSANTTVFGITGNLTERNTTYSALETVNKTPVGKLLLGTKMPWDAIFRKNSSIGVRVDDESLLADGIGLTADRIKQGETILGVEGTYGGKIDDYFATGEFLIDISADKNKSIVCTIQKFPEGTIFTFNNSDLTSLFYSYSRLKKLPNATFKYNPKVTRTMYFDCEDLTDVYELDYSEITDAFRMYSNCYNLTSVTGTGVFAPTGDGANYMFYKCRSLNNIDLEIDLSNCTEFNGAFVNCSQLEYLPPITYGNNIRAMYDLFNGCESLKRIDLSTLTNYTNLYDVGLNGTFDGVPNDCEIVVIDEDMKNWLLGYYPNLTNIVY